MTPSPARELAAGPLWGAWPAPGGSAPPPAPSPQPAATPPPPRAGTDGPEDDCAGGPGQQGEDLPVAQLGRRSGFAAAAADSEELPLGTSADQQASVHPGQGVEERLHPQPLAWHAAGVEPVD